MNNLTLFYFTQQNLTDQFNYFPSNGKHRFRYIGKLSEAKGCIWDSELAFGITNNSRNVMKILLQNHPLKVRLRMGHLVFAYPVVTAWRLVETEAYIVIREVFVLVCHVQRWLFWTLASKFVPAEGKSKIY